MKTRFLPLLLTSICIVSFLFVGCSDNSDNPSNISKTIGPAGGEISLRPDW
jgi:hypothetical protein